MIKKERQEREIKKIPKKKKKKNFINCLILLTRVLSFLVLLYKALQF